MQCKKDIDNRHVPNVNNAPIFSNGTHSYLSFRWYPSEVCYQYQKILEIIPAYHFIFKQDPNMHKQTLYGCSNLNINISNDLEMNKRLSSHNSDLLQ